MIQIETSSMNINYKYRREIDGLRAIAVIPVILFHAGFKICPGGYIGVDVFFVISGYLIANIIINEMNSNTFSFFNFYLRRARRILPALFFVILICIPISFFTLFPRDFHNFSGSLNTTLLFLSNIFFWKTSGGYFSTRAELQPLIHTWSLAIEEQFYIIFPAILLVSIKFFKNKFYMILILIGASSIISSEFASYTDQDANFYLLHNRAWELILGALSSVIYFQKQKSINNIISILSLIILIIIFFTYNEDVNTHLRLIPVLITAILILTCSSDTLTYKILSNQFLQYIGKLSYSAYLIHQPLFAFARNISIFEIDIIEKSIILLSIFPLAYLQYNWIEKPFRHSPQLKISNSKFTKFSRKTNCITF